MAAQPKPAGQLSLPLRRCGALGGGSVQGSLTREDYVILMPDAEFASWVDQRRARAAGDAIATAAESRAIEADRRLRAWARAGGLKRSSPGQSPLEERMLQAFLESGQFTPPKVASDIVVGHGPAGMLMQQVPVAKRYWLDFAVMNPGRDVFLAIEVDGHDFHERTKEQAQRDRSRDRELTAAGWRVLRFTGREVYQDAGKCVREVLAVVARR